jgi:hypothetical protein
VFVFVLDTLNTPAAIREATRQMFNAMGKVMQMGEFAQAIGSNPSTIRMWIRAGYIRTLMPEGGRGTRLEFGSDSLVQGKAAVAIQKYFGDGEAARLAMAKVSTLKAGDRELVVEGPDSVEVKVYVA